MSKFKKPFQRKKRDRSHSKHESGGKKDDILKKKEIGRLGKLQRSKKHKKIKAIDPFFEGERLNRNQKLKLKNLAPKNDDDQEIPKKLKFYMKHKDEFSKKGERKQKKKQSGTTDIIRVERGMSRPMKSVPDFVQKQGEQDHTFLNRVERETKRVLLKSKLEEQFKVDLDETGDEVIVKKQGMSEHRKQRLVEKKKNKSLKKKEKQMDKKGDFSVFKDVVKFGEVAMQPPSLTVKPRKATVEKGSAKPGQRSLLLKEIIRDNAAHTPGSSTSKREIGKSVKRKNLSLYQQQLMDTERQRVVDLYRQLKEKEQIKS